MADTAIISSAVLGLAGIGSGLWIARDGRRHEEWMVRAGRSYDARRDLYVDIFAYFHRLKLLIARTEPFVVPAAGPPPVPDMPSEEDGIRLGAMTSALGSSELNAAPDACLAASRQWRASVGIYRCVKVQLGDTDQQTVTARMDMHTFSERYDEKVGELELLVRGELGSAT